jgi:hypothetical protein
MRTILTLITLFTFTLGFANNNEKKAKMFSISGKVIDKQETLTGVEVLLDGKKTTIYTDFDVNFTINNVVKGKHTVSFNLITYETKSIILDSKDNETVTVELKEK